MIDSFELFCWH